MIAILFGLVIIASVALFLGLKYLIAIILLCFAAFIVTKLLIWLYCDCVAWYRWFYGIGPSKEIEEFASYVASGEEEVGRRIGRRNRYRESAPLVRRILNHLIMKGLDPKMEYRPDNIGVVRFEVSHFVQRLVREENLRLKDAKVAVLAATEAFFIPDDETVDFHSMQSTKAAVGQRNAMWYASATSSYFK
jgi:hypothetical protein